MEQHTNIPFYVLRTIWLSIQKESRSLQDFLDYEVDSDEEWEEEEPGESLSHSEGVSSFYVLKHVCEVSVLNKAHLIWKHLNANPSCEVPSKDGISGVFIVFFFFLTKFDDEATVD